ncbi:hypothetical protein [Dehalogenimonas etheniformans]|uniref:Uncharacterized protein n=1 Tax=Dehalogenimonas etheniformans TaxID=1536648 RepID=A0A2P5P7M5_9CHLR|nr:hypothetical protein [Dehalogenimonas etheniformans]PPD58308.1 hypothetical protein JP09_005825 [Dehalogenimonas etheniformans]QNT75718.1 hypothetical protein HX448_02935 [Dehalogenimonas etheniformans]
MSYSTYVPTNRPNSPPQASRNIVFRKNLGETIRPTPFFTIEDGHCFNNWRVVLTENEPEIRVVFVKIRQKWKFNKTIRLSRIALHAVKADL